MRFVRKSILHVHTMRSVLNVSVAILKMMRCLISVLELDFGLTGTALSWIQSFLSVGTQ